MANITLRSVKASPLTNTEVDDNFSALNTELATKANSISPSLTTPTLGAASATSIAASLGAVGAPAYTFTGDADTGMWSPAADTLAFSEGGVEAMRITSAGNVGIGTASPVAYAGYTALTIEGATGGGVLALRNSASTASVELAATTAEGYLKTVGSLPFTFSTNNTERMRITSAGNVGIGTNNPGTWRTYISQAGSNLLYLYNSSGTGVSLNMADQGWAGGINMNSGNLLFNAGGITERMRLDTSGNLLVGATANPGVLNKSVVINSGADSLAGLVLQNNATGTGSTDGSHITIAATDLIIANAENAATIFKTNNTERMRIESSGIVTAAIAFNAPVFNDSNDSNYYTNPFGTSNLLGLTVANTITGSVSGSAATSGSAGALYSNTGAVSAGLQVWNEISNTTLNPSAEWHYGLRMGHGDAATYYSATLAIPFFSDSLYMRRKTGGTDNTWRRFWHNGDASITASTDFQAPVFKDSDNAAFYLDAAGTSNLLGLTVTNTITGSVSGSAGSLSNTTNYFINRGDIAAASIDSATGLGVWKQLNAGDSHTIISAGAGGSTNTVQQRFHYLGSMEFRNNTDGANWQPWKTVLTNTNYTSYAMPSGASATNSVEVRAPIFKDSNNSAFYLDPDSTSVLTTVKSGAFGTRNDISVDNGFGIYFNENMVNNYAIYRGPGTWVWPYPDLRIGFHTGIQIGANANYQGVRFYTDYDMVTQVMSVNNEFDALGAGNVYVNNNLQAGVSLRAPVFYNTPDTAFYVDPNSTSILSALTLGGRSTSLAMYYQGFTLDANTMDSNATGFTYAVNAPAVGPIARFSAGGGYDLQLNAPYAGNGNKLFYRIRQGDAGVFNPWFSVATYDVNYGSGELYATKFSDAVNSGYYLNPDSTSALYDAIVIGPNPSWSAYLRVGGNGANSDMATVAASNGNLHMDSKNAGYHMYLNHSSNGNIMMGGGGGYAEAYQSLRAPIFYDSVSTGYFLDAAATSNLYVVLSASYQGNGNVGGTGSASWHPSGIYSAGHNWLYGGISVGAGDINNAGVVNANTFRSQSDSTHYLAPSGYSQINGNGSTAGSAGIGFNIYSTGANGAIMAFHRGGNFAINMGLDSDNVFRIGGWSMSANRLQMDTAGNLTMAGNVTAYSDARLKENIITVTDALNLVGRMRGVTYIRKDTGEAGVGVIAQEMLEILPQVVQQGIGDDDTLSVAYGNIVGVLIEAIKELENKVTTLESRLH